MLESSSIMLAGPPKTSHLGGSHMFPARIPSPEGFLWAAVVILGLAIRSFTVIWLARINRSAEVEMMRLGAGKATNINLQIDRRSSDVTALSLPATPSCDADVTRQNTFPPCNSAPSSGTSTSKPRRQR